MENDLPKRKLNRMPNYDYTQYGYYFITICAHNHKPIFGHIEYDKMILNDYGKKVEKLLQDTISNIKAASLKKHVIMPNHIHMIISIENDNVSDVNKIGVVEIVRDFKSLSTMIYIDGVKKGLYEPYEKKLWQRSYYDRIIRDDKSFLATCNYIDNNPLKWAIDKYHYHNSI